MQPIDNQAAVPVTDLQIQKQHTTVTIEPTAFVDGFEADSYDSAEVTTMLWLNNTEERWVEIVIPFSTEKFSSSIAVISAGSDEYEDRIHKVNRIRGDVDRFIPYLRRLGVNEEQLSKKDELKKLLKGFRVAMVHLPVRQLVLRIQSTMIVESDVADNSRKTFKFRAYAPLPSFLAQGNAIPLKMHVIFKCVDDIPRIIQTPVVSNPFGNNVGDPAATDDKIVGGDRIFYWFWKQDPVVDFTYTYQS